MPEKKGYLEAPQRAGCGDLESANENRSHGRDHVGHETENHGLLGC